MREIIKGITNGITNVAVLLVFAFFGFNHVITDIRMEQPNPGTPVSSFPGCQIDQITGEIPTFIVAEPVDGGPTYVVGFDKGWQQAKAGKINVRGFCYREVKK